MKLEGKVDSMDGMAIVRESMWDGYAFRAYVVKPDGTHRFVQISVPATMLDEIKHLQPGQRVRVSVDVIEEGPKP